MNTFTFLPTNRTEIPVLSRAFKRIGIDLGRTPVRGRKTLNC